MVKLIPPRPSANVSAHSTHPAERGTKIAAADAVRALAIFSVVVYHILQLAQPTWHGQPHVFFELGVWGVDFFFVLSGFLLGGAYVRRLLSPEITLQSTRLFWAKRLLRIVPLYAACVILSALFDALVLHDVPSAGDIAAHLFFLHGFNAATATSINGPFWTMPVDMEFYAMLPIYALVMAAFFRAKPRARREPAIVWSLVIITVAGVAYRYLQARYNPLALHSFADEVVWMRNAVGMSGAFCLGVALALPSVRKARPSPLVSAICLAIAVVCIVVVEHTSALEPGPPTTRLIIGQSTFDFIGAISAALVMYVVVEGNFSFVNRFVRLRFISEIAAIAYGVYLLHYPIVEAVTPWFAHLGNIGRVTGIGVATIVPTVVVAYIANRTIERPFLNIKGRIRT